MKASDIMTKEIISVGPDTPIADVVATLLENRVSAVPVVEHGTIVGIISEGDLLRRPETGTERRRSRWLELARSNASLAADYVKTHGRWARDVMTEPVITVAPDTPVAEVANILESHHIKRVPVVQDGKPVGIVSRANLVQALASRESPPALASGPDDREIRDALLDELRRQRWATSPSEANVIVDKGVVHLWGIIRSEEERKAVLVATENTPGVRRIKDHMEYPVAVRPF
jgi:CBS domain-containing protein